MIEQACGSSRGTEHASADLVVIGTVLLSGFPLFGVSENLIRSGEVW